MEARVTRLVSVFNYANVVVKEQFQFELLVFSFIDRWERADEVHFNLAPPNYVTFIVTSNTHATNKTFTPFTT